MNTDRPLRFCMITTFYPPYSFGGDGIYVHRLSNELAKRGHHVEVIHSEDAYRLRAQKPIAGDFENHSNVRVHSLASRSSFLSSLITQQVGAPLVHANRIRQILQAGFDVINYHNVSLVGGPQILTYGKGIKLYSIHEYWLVCPTHVLFRDNREACTQPHCLRCSLFYRRPPQWWRYSHALPNAAQHIDRFIAPSRFCQDIHRRDGFEAPMAHLPYFVPSAELAPIDGSQDPYFLFVGRLEKLKGVQTLIPIFRNYPGATLLVVGKGDYEAALHASARGVTNIRFLGHMAGTELLRLYRNAIALIVPSLCYEAFPLVVVEAFQQQTPVIVRNLGAMPEIIQESGGGLAYSTDAELVSAMDRLISDSSYRHGLGTNGYAAYQKNWTTEAHLEHYFALIAQVMKQRSK